MTVTVNNSNTQTNSTHFMANDNENISFQSVNHQLNNNNNESKVPQKAVETDNSEEQTSTPESTTPTEPTSLTSPSAQITGTCVSHTVLPIQTISSLSESCENNSSSSLSTVDSLDEIKPSKRVINNKVLSPVRESSEITPNNTPNKCSNDVIIPKTEDCLKNTKNKEIVKNKSCLPSDSTTPASASASSASTSGSAMAFIIPFDSDDKSSKKKMNIKDSIRQFAPPKPDSIEKPRPQKTNNNDLNKSDNLFANQKSPTMQSKQKSKSSIKSLPVKNRSPVHNIIETNGHLSDSATYLIHRMLCSETQNIMPVKNVIENSNNRRNSSDLSSKSTPNKEKCSPSNSGEKDSGVSDDNKSETGTYTVDQNDDDIEDARKKIDEIFGVFDDSNTFSYNSSSECASPDIAINSAQNILLSHEKSESNNLFVNQSFSSPKFSRKFVPIKEISDSSQNQNSIANTSTFTRSKRKPPIPQNYLSKNDYKLNDQNLSEENDENNDKDFTPVYSNDSSNRVTNNFDLKPSRNQNSSLTKKSYNTSQNFDILSNNSSSNKSKPVSISHSAPTTPRSPLVLRKILQLQLKDNSKVNNNNNQRKNSWSYSNSDLDHCDSYNSDESTDQSQRSSNSALSKDGGNVSSASVSSKMRFNRAFALRRARLGIETPGIPVDINKNKTQTNTNAKQQQQQKSSFSRNDGGRFSLRLPKNNNIDNSRKQFNQNNLINRISSQEKAKKAPLQRKISDPMNNKAISGNRSALKATLSDNDRPINNRANSPWIQSLRQNSYTNNNNSFHDSNNSLQKSSSFSESKVIECSRNSDNGSVRGIPTFQVGKRFFSTKPHQMAQIESSIRAKSIGQKPGVMSLSMTESSHKSPDSPSAGKSSSQHQNKSMRELSALDGLVVSAINQLSQKMRTNMRCLLEKERLKHQIGTETRVMIDEILPQVSSPDKRLNDNNESNISRDLSNILKNLKKVEQSFDGKEFNEHLVF